MSYDEEPHAPRERDEEEGGDGGKLAAMSKAVFNMHGESIRHSNTSQTLDSILSPAPSYTSIEEIEQNQEQQEANTKIVNEGNTETLHDEDAEEQLLTISRAEMKEMDQREVVASLLSRDSLKDEAIVSGLNTTHTHASNVNHYVADNNKCLDDDDLSFASGHCEVTNNKSNASSFTSSGNHLNAVNNAVHNLQGEDLSKRILAMEEQFSLVAGKLNIVEVNVKNQVQEIRSEMNNLLVRPNVLQRSDPSPTKNRSLTDIFKRPFTDNMPHDTFSLMMISTPYNKSWWYSFALFVFQMVLYILIAYNQLILGSYFNVPFNVDPEVRVAQFMSILFCVAIQSDVLVSIQTLTLMWRTTRWDKPILERGDDTDRLGTLRWILHILLPNLMRLAEGILGLFVSFVVIVQSDNIIDLLRDFTALMVVSEVDNLGFRLVADGYIGEEMYHEAVRVKNITLLERSNQPLTLATAPGDKSRKCNSFVFRPLILTTILSCLIASWMRIVLYQVGGEIFYDRFPDCMGVTYESVKDHFGDGICYGGNLNTLGCEFEGGDCNNFNVEYPSCRGDDLVDVEVELANGKCNMAFAIDSCGFDNNTCCSLEYTTNDTFGDGVCNFDRGFGPNAKGPNTKECNYENGDCFEYNEIYCSDENDCCPLSIVNGASFGNGICNDDAYNTEECGWDGGDCIVYNSLVNCTVGDPSQFGNGRCDNRTPFNTEECGWDGGDCDLYNSLVNCTVNDPSELGNGQCDDRRPYYTEECGWDGGDCPPS